MIYLMFNWAPTMLFSAGFGLQTASLGLTSFNVGGTIGAMLASLAIIRFGSRAVLILMAVIGAAVCASLALLPISGGRNEAAVLACLGALGLFASAAQSAMFAVGAHAFPTALRARGLGLMGAAGRVGAIVSALTGAMLIGGGNRGFFGALAALMLVNAVGFIAIRGHVPRLTVIKGPRE
jgi:AAHS family 4-hydroxybenzoate transporter-like MFS transporter